ncbi:MAG: IPT/TIG domain-containing protein [Deltaproteobacteria bacterium]|nr:IPT/TIG domain-containing protein [Deltaproteobacteria bacterium]
MRLLLSIAVVSLVCACGDADRTPPVERPVRDAGFVRFDARPSDASSDAGTPSDATSPDTGPSDRGFQDVADLDAVSSDLGPVDLGQPDLGIDDGSVDSGFPDADSVDVGTHPDATPEDVGPPPDAGVVTQQGGLVITELMVSGASEWIEVENVGTTSIDLTDLVVRTFSRSALGDMTIRAVTDPSGTAGTAVPLAPSARAFGSPNPASAASIPAGATFVFGAPGLSSVFADGGDLVELSGPGLFDRVDFRAAATVPGSAVGVGEFPLVSSVSLTLSAGAGTSPTANDSGDAWCAPIFTGATPGTVNLRCDTFVISEFSYDYASLSGGVDDANEFVELAGPAGGSFTNLTLVTVEGTSPAGAVDRSVAISGGRMPLDGLWVVADRDSSGMTQIANSDQLENLDLENGPDALQLVRSDVPPVLLDAVGYGAITATNDTTRGLACSEGTPVSDWNPFVHALDFARSDAESDTQNNLADFRYDPSPTPGARNGVDQFSVIDVSPRSGVVATATITLTGRDFTDGMSLRVGAQDVPFSACDYPGPDVYRCLVPAPVAAGRVDVTLTARAEHGGVAVMTQVFTWTTSANESGLASEADYVNLQYPPSISMAAGTSPMIFARIYEQGVTDVTSGPSASILVELGFGPAGTDPRSSNDWSFVPAAFNVEYGNDDEYMGTVTVTTPGTYSYTHRFSLDGGLSFTYADLDGAGQNGGLDFDPTRLGALTVTP